MSALSLLLPLLAAPAARPARCLTLKTSAAACSARRAFSLWTATRACRAPTARPLPALTLLPLMSARQIAAAMVIICTAAACAIRAGPAMTALRAAIAVHSRSVRPPHLMRVSLIQMMHATKHASTIAAAPPLLPLPMSPAPSALLGSAKILRTESALQNSSSAHRSQVRLMGSRSQRRPVTDRAATAILVSRDLRRVTVRPCPSLSRDKP